MKKLFALLLVLCMVFTLVACSNDTPAKPDDNKGDTPAGDVTITLWTYPIGGWGNSDTVDQLIAAFEAANPGIKVSVEYLAYADGDDKVNTAIGGKAAPDLIMEGPERLVANWGAKGYMVDIADLCDDADKEEILPVVQAACFNKEDASANVREINQAAIRKYIADAPWGIGIGIGYENVPANNKFRKLSTIPPDSEYVFIWVHTGPIGLTVFLITTAMMFLGACSTVFFRLKSRSLIGVGGSLCGAFAAIQLGGYGNQVLMQFPNCLIFYGGLAIVYILPYIEDDWVVLEEKRFAAEEEKKRLKLEKKLAQRV
jgi:hypothetical protein